MLLDAAELMNVGVNYLREHVADDVRMHYTYTNTDETNIVPPLPQRIILSTQCLWKKTKDASGDVDNCAKGRKNCCGVWCNYSVIFFVTNRKFAPPVSSTFVLVAESRYIFSSKPFA